jgi:hypothetical protein
MSIEMDVWVRGTVNAVTRHLTLETSADRWSDADVRTLLTEMLLAIEREKNPGGEPPPVTLRGFSWIVSPYESGGVILHLEMVMGTASAGPLAIDEARLTGMVNRVLAPPPQQSERVH